LVIALVAWPFERPAGRRRGAQGRSSDERRRSAQAASESPYETAASPANGRWGDEPEDGEGWVRVGEHGSHAAARGARSSGGAGEGAAGGSPSQRRVAILLVAGVVLALLVAAVAFAEATQGSAIGRHVSVNGVSLGGLTVDQAVRKLENVELAAGSVRLVWQGRHWTLTGRSLHARIQAHETAAAAYAYTRSGNVAARLWDRFALLFSGHAVEPSVTYGEPVTRERLDAIASAVDVKPVEGAVTVEGVDPVVRAAQDGRAVDRAGVLRLLDVALQSQTHDTAALPVVTVKPAVSTSDAQAAAATVRQWLSGPLSLTHAGHTWTIARKDLGQYVSFVHQQGTPHLRVTFDSPVTRGYFSYITAQVGQPGKNATFTVTNGGKRVWVTPGTSGYGVVPGPTIANMDAAAARGGSRVAAAVFGKAPPALSYADAKALRITTRIGTYTTSVAGTTNRLDNVALGSALLNNSLIAPGKIFSVNATTGERTAAKGFKMAPTIINGKLEDSVGGGMCQVSTTVFNAAFVAGLQIVERHNHELYISHYPLGRDATVSYGSYDLKFRNDTPNWILLKTDFTGWSLTVSLYSAPLHRRVVAWTNDWYDIVPFTVHKQHDPTLAQGKTTVQTPGIDGMSIDCFRKVYAADGKLVWDDDFKSVYSMVPEILLVGSKKPTPNPSASATPTGTPSPKPSGTTSPH
jgi:vancomycin resistance protein YoaR